MEFTQCPSIVLAGTGPPGRYLIATGFASEDCTDASALCPSLLLRQR